MGSEVTAGGFDPVTDPELKGGHIEPPAAKRRFFGVLESRRIGASRCLSVARDCASVDSTPKKFQIFFFWRVWASFLPLTSHLILGTVLSWGASTKGGVVSCSTSNKDPKSTLFFVDAPQLRLERQP